MTTWGSVRRASLVALSRSVPLVAALSSPALPPLLKGVPVRDLGRLRPGRPKEHLIADDRHHAYRVFLRQGEAARIDVDQKTVDVRIRVFDPKRELIAEIDGVGGSVGPEPMVIVAASPGEYRVVVWPRWGSALGGRYRIELREPRPAGPADRACFEAQSLYSRLPPLRSRNPQEVLRLGEEALRLWREAGDAEGEARVLYLIGEAKGHLGDFEAALSAWTEVAAIAARLGDRDLEATALSTRGFRHLRLGEVVKAETDLMEASAIFTEIGDRFSEAVTGGNLAELAVQKGEIQRGLRLYERLLEMTRLTHDELREGVALNDLASAYQRAGHFARARVLFEEALRIVRIYGDDRHVAGTLHNLGSLALATGDPERALGLLEESLRRRGEIDPYGKSFSLTQLGRAYAAVGQAALAREKLEQALALRDERDVSGQAFVLQQLASVYADAGERSRALEIYGQALAMHRQARQRAREADTLYGMARVLLAEGRFVEARQRIEETLAIVESLRWTTGSRNLRAFFLGSVRDYYETEIAVLMAMHRRSPAEGLDAVAFESSERARARSLVEFLNEARAGRPGPGTPVLRSRQEEVRRLLAIKGERQVRLASRPHAPEEEAALATEIDELSRQYDEVEGEIQKADPQRSGVVGAGPPTLRSLQELLDDETLLLEYALGDERSYAWLISRGSFRSYELPARSRLEPLARTLHEAWSRPPAAGTGAAGPRLAAEMRALSEQLLGPLAGELAKRRLLVILDGALHYVPFASLSLGDRPLLSDHEVVALPSGATLAALRSIREARPRPPKTVAVLADPVYDAEDPRVRRAAGRPSVGRRVAESASARALDIEAGPRLGRLAFSRMEAGSILGLVPPSERLQALGFDASRATAMAPRLADYRIVHFASHAVLNRRHPDLSGIVLSLVDPGGRDQPGLLSLLDVVNLDLHADLVVLSACQTAVGEEVPGEGLMSLARGFMHAGASAVLASLWKVDDSATAELMSRFYAVLLGPRRLSPASALRTAQLEMQTQPRWQDPHFWAAFVLLGE